MPHRPGLAESSRQAETEPPRSRSPLRESLAADLQCDARDRSLRRRLCAPRATRQFERSADRCRIESGIRCCSSRKLRNIKPRTRSADTKERATSDHHHGVTQCRSLASNPGFRLLLAAESLTRRLRRPPRRTMPKIAVAVSHINAVNATTVTSMRIESSRGRFSGASYRRTRIPAHARPSPSACTGRRQQPCLGQQRAQSAVHGFPPSPPGPQVPLAQRSPHEQQVRHVRAGNQQQEDCRTHQRQNRRPHMGH